MSPPERESRPGEISETAPETDHHHANQVIGNATCSGRQLAFDTLAAIHHRRRPYRPGTGLRAGGYREGYAAALRWVQLEFCEHLDAIGKARLAAVVARSDAA